MTPVYANEVKGHLIISCIEGLMTLVDFVPNMPRYTKHADNGKRKCVFLIYAEIRGQIWYEVTTFDLCTKMMTLNNTKYSSKVTWSIYVTHGNKLGSTIFVTTL